MQLTLWTYEGPPHVGAMRVATAMRDVHYVLHAPQGDTYADLLFTMIERLPRRPPVTYTTFQARDLGGDTAELFKTAAREAYERFQPKAMMVGASCTAELIQDDPGGLARALNLPVPVVALELPSYQRKENWGAAKPSTRWCARWPEPPAAAGTPRPRAGPRRARAATCWGPTALGFPPSRRPAEITGLLERLGIDVQRVAPWAPRRRPRPPGRRRLQRRAVPGIARTRGAMAAAQLRPADDPHRADRRRRHARLHRRGGQLAGIDPAPALADADECARPGIRARSTPPT
jgi:light-independent protochlorophyllide reductase B subunit